MRACQLLLVAHCSKWRPKTMKLKPHQRVPIATAEIRALQALLKTPLPASYVAAWIWPDHKMKPQGAGAAASRVLKRLEAQGCARWVSDGVRWGWVKSMDNAQ